MGWSKNPIQEYNKANRIGIIYKEGTIMDLYLTVIFTSPHKVIKDNTTNRKGEK